MSQFVVIAYPDQHRAAEVLAALQRMRADYLLDLDDARTITRADDGKVTLHTDQPLTPEDVKGGHFWNRLAATLFEPGPGVTAVGNAAGQRFSDLGVDEAFMEKLGEQLQPGSSAILVLVRDVTVDKVLPEVSKFGGTVLRTSLTAEGEAELRSALASPEE